MSYVTAGYHQKTHTIHQRHLCVSTFKNMLHTYTSRDHTLTIVFGIHRISQLINKFFVTILSFPRYRERVKSLDVINNSQITLFVDNFDKQACVGNQHISVKVPRTNVCYVRQYHFSYNTKKARTTSIRLSLTLAELFATLCQLIQPRLKYVNKEFTIQILNV